MQLFTWCSAVIHAVHDVVHRVQRYIFGRNKVPFPFKSTQFFELTFAVLVNHETFSSCFSENDSEIESAISICSILLRLFSVRSLMPIISSLAQFLLFSRGL